MPSTFHKVASFSVDHRPLVVVFLALITTCATIGHRDPQILLDLFDTSEQEAPGRVRARR